MRPSDAREHLARLLRQRGVPLAEEGGSLVGPGDSARDAWAAFCEIAAEPADEPFEKHGRQLRVPDHEDADLLLHESGLGGSDRETFVIDFTRQFSFEDDSGAYAGMNGLTLAIECEGRPEGRVPHAQRWGYAGRRRPSVDDRAHPEISNWAGHLDHWREAVEASNSFRLLDVLPARRFVLTQDDY